MAYSSDTFREISFTFPYLLGQRAKSATKQPTSCLYRLNLLFKGTIASRNAYELPVLLLKDSQSVSLNNRPPFTC